MGVYCQILIHKTREGVHRAGEAVTGVVKYFVDEPTEYQDVVLSFLGKGRCVWQQRHGKTTTTYRGTEDYIVRHVNICNKRPEDIITLNGQYEYPFEFILPEDIPRSYKDMIGAIKYYIELKFVKPSFFSFNKVFTAEIPVYSSVTYPEVEGPVIFGLEKSLFAPFSSSDHVVNLKAEIAKTCLIPGENAHLSLVVENKTDVVITAVRVNLYCYTTYTANCGRVKKVTNKVQSCEVETPSVAQWEVKNLTCILPTNPQLYSIQHSKVISKEYKVNVTVRLPLPHLNATVEMPILIGEKKGSIDPCTEAEEIDNEPPSYWEAVCEEKDKEKK